MIYAYLAVVALVIGLFGSTAFYHNLYKSDEQKIEYLNKSAKLEKDVQDAKDRKLEEDSKALAVSLEKYYKDQIAASRQKVTEGVSHVSIASNKRCIVPVGFVYDLNYAASRGQEGVPAAASRLADQDSGLTLSVVTDSIKFNYQQCNEAVIEVATWRTWYVDQKNLFEGKVVEVK